MRKRYINVHSYSRKKKVDHGPRINKRYKILLFLIIVAMSILVVNLYYVQVVRHEYYQEVLAKLTQNIVEGETAPRGRIYDRNGKLLVDNIAVKTITYKKPVGVKASEEIEMAYQVANIIELDYSTLKESDLRYFWVRCNPDLANDKITSEERTLVKERKLTDKDIEEFKLSRVTEEELAEYDELDYEAVYIYTLMNKGYSYAEKTIKRVEVTDEEYAIIAENGDKLKGFKTRIDWERYYPYGETFRAVLGNISSSGSGVPAELKDEYLSMGYQLTDRVGISYLELQYESVLRGTKTKYTVSGNGEYRLLEEGKRGNDIVLTIDIDLQIAVEKIITDEIHATRKTRMGKYFTTGFVIIQNPQTGEILAMAGKEYVKSGRTYEIHDFATGTIRFSVTAGSSVKGASHMVGYKTGALKIGEVRNDACVKLAGAPQKCSFGYYGNVNDLRALQISSNTYQFHTAIKVAGYRYSYNMGFKASEKAFNTYRSTFAQFGLGVKTGIDLPNETAGLRGSSDYQSGLLLDFAIGQYDNYTPMQLSQYISTIANGGNRMEPHLLKAVYEPTDEKLTNLIYSVSPVVLNTVEGEKKYMDRIREGFRMVTSPGGTGNRYISAAQRPAGKTGTSQSFLDTNGDGRIDTATLSTVFLAYAPHDNPRVSFTVITPHVSPDYASYASMPKVNRRITEKVSKKYFEIYK